MKERNIVDVIDSMLIHVPKDKIEFIERLNKISCDSAYRAPEDKWQSWYKLQAAVGSEVGVAPTHDWHFRICSILSTKSEEQLRKEVKEFLKIVDEQ